MSMLNKDDIIKLYGPNPDKWDWFGISCASLSEDFIREFKNRVHWVKIIRYQRLSENFIREFQNELNTQNEENWARISHLQVLSENFIREFQNKVNWECISIYQKLSENFINEFKDKINMRFFVSYNPSCPPDIRIKYMIDFNLIKKQDPSTHDFEYFEQPKQPKQPKDNSLQLLKELICQC